MIDDYIDNLYMIPPHMHEGMLNYIERGYRPGGFLSAVISNDLKGAFGKADSTNIKVIGEYLKYFYNYAPSGCWGSPEKFEAWITLGGLQ